MFPVAVFQLPLFTRHCTDETLLPRAVAEPENLMVVAALGTVWVPGGTVIVTVGTPTAIVEMVTDKVPMAVRAGLLLSLAWTVKLNVPVEVGVPLMVPSLLSSSPGGRLPPPSDQVYGGVPPLAASVVL